MKKGYKRQILNHNFEKFSIIIRDDINMFSSTEILIQANQNTKLQVNSVSSTKKIRKKSQWNIERNEQVKLEHSWFSCHYWYLAEIVEDKANILELIDALIVFINQKRVKTRVGENIGNERHKKIYSNWAKKYSIQVHSSITI